ncbi:MAG: EthD family reductase [Chloroflexota bacterium]
MIRVTINYPQGGKFDADYYASKHMPMIAEKCGAALVKYEIDKGVAGAVPGQPAPYVGVGHLYFNSLPEFMGAFGPHFGAIAADVPNYTDQTPILQISEIVVGG